MSTPPTFPFPAFKISFTDSKNEGKEDFFMNGRIVIGGRGVREER